MKKFFKNNQLRWVWLSLFVLIVDQIAKRLVLHYLDLYQSIHILPFFNLTLVFNKGAAFSFLNSASGWQSVLFSGFAIVASVVVLIWLSRVPKNNHLLAIALAFILGGALGNLCDRMLLGYVIDYFDFYIGHWHWPAFNVADAAICIGAVMLIVEWGVRKRIEG